ncbi:hypothetical protein FTX61_12810 [Nitriliruptoraceae bacterium ZYF776]|nr:hypothetical protein [Profundirhabdus halotolerans]
MRVRGTADVDGVSAREDTAGRVTARGRRAGHAGASRWPVRDGPDAVCGGRLEPRWVLADRGQERVPSAPSARGRCRASPSHRRRFRPRGGAPPATRPPSGTRAGRPTVPAHAVTVHVDVPVLYLASSRASRPLRP